MKLSLSDFGKKLGGHSGINELMSDLGEAMAINPKLLMMGGGNPARIPAVEKIWRERMRELLEQGDSFEKVLANYDQPRGSPDFIEALVCCLNEHFGWGLTRKNVCVTNGSQNSFFFLFNMLAGASGGARKKILLPLSPEYIGYADQGIDPELFVSFRPKIEERGDHEFKYHIDFDALKIADDVAAICVSRPTNPSGNVLTDAEMKRLSAMTKERGIFLMVDNAYGAPFPDIIFSEIEPFWDEHVILTLSLSKLGLPGTRSGIVIAREDVIEALSGVNAIVSLANGNLGQALVTPLLRNGELLKMSREIIRPFYEAKSRAAISWIHEALGDSVDFRLHASEGALFLWLWLPGLKISSAELYRRLKVKNLLVVSGHYFFYGLHDPQWRHAHECLRLTYSQPENVVREGIKILADEVRRVQQGT